MARWAIAPLALIAGLAIAACGSSGGGGGSESGGSKEAGSGTIPVTFVADQTGLVSYVGEKVIAGMKLAVEEANNSGELGKRKIVLSIANSNSDTATATTQMAAAVKSNAVAVFGPALSAEALATAPLAQRAKVVDIGTLSEDTGFLPIGNYIYRLTCSQLRYDPLIVEHVAKLGLKSTKIVYASDNPTLSEETTEHMVPELEKDGVKVQGTVGIPSTTTEFSSLATKLESGNPASIGLMVVGAANPDLITALRHSGYKGVIWGEQAATAGSLVPAGELANGFFYAVDYTESLPYESSKKFTELFKQKYPKETPYGYDANGYDAMKAFAKAVALEGSGPVTRESVLKGMQKEATSGGFEGASGKTIFVGPEHRDIAVPGVLVEWKDGAEHVLKLGTPGLEQQK